MTSTLKKIGVSGLLLALIGGSGAWFYFSNKHKIHEQNLAAREAINLNAMKKNLPRMIIQDSREGSGSEASQGNTVVLNYTLRLADGKIVDQKIVDQTDGKLPLEIKIGSHQTVEGLEYGVLGMKPNGRRFITVPPHLGYGEKGAGSGLIPPNAVMIYEVELLKIK